MILRMPRLPRGFSFILLLLLIACGGDQPADTGVGPIDEDTGPRDPGPYPPLLLDESHLVGGLFGWPETDFGRGNSATIEIFRTAGMPAVDFTLQDLDGEAVRLAELLRTRPVLLVLGSFT